MSEPGAAASVTDPSDATLSDLTTPRQRQRWATTLAVTLFMLVRLLQAVDDSSAGAFVSAAALLVATAVLVGWARGDAPLSPARSRTLRRVALTVAIGEAITAIEHRSTWRVLGAVCAVLLALSYAFRSSRPSARRDG